MEVAEQDIKKLKKTCGHTGLQFLVSTRESYRFKCDDCGEATCRRVTQDDIDCMSAYEDNANTKD